jgi:hypothetical protein
MGSIPWDMPPEGRVAAHREDLTADVLIAVIKARALACKPFIKA